MSNKANQAVILAAGAGSRLQGLGDGEAISKPLVKIVGEELILRTLRTLNKAGINKFVIVLGYMADKVQAVMEEKCANLPLEIEFVFNPKWKGYANGLSLLVAEEKVEDKFLLSMCDHAFDISIPTRLVAEDDESCDVKLCIDRKIDSVYDLDDATKVVTRDDKIIEIGKELGEYNAVDCGLFLCRRTIFKELHAINNEKGDCSLSDGMRRLGEKSRFGYLDIKDAMWQDADTPETLEHAEKLMSEGIIRFP